MRRADVLAIGGFDPIFMNGMEDVDLGLRMSQVREGRFCVGPDSIVLHHESKAPGRFKSSLANRRIMLDRHRATVQGDDVALWAALPAMTSPVTRSGTWSRTTGGSQCPNRFWPNG